MLWMSPYLSRYLEVRQRQVYFWQRRDLLGVLATAGIIAAAAYMLYVLVKWSRSARLLALFKTCFIICLLYLLSANLIRAMELVDGAKWMRNLGLTVLLGAAATIAVRCRNDFGRMTRIALAASWSLSIVPVVLLVWLCNFDNELGNYGTLPAVPKAASERNVYIIVLDDWSYRRSFEGRDLRADLPNLAALAADSTVFHNAFMPTSDPPDTLPLLLKQTTDGSNNLVEQANRMKFYTAVVGYYFNYRTMLGTTIDFCRSFSGYKIPDQSLMDTALYHFVKTARYPFKRLPGDSDKLLDSYVMNRMHARRLPVFHALVREIISKQIGATYGIFHYPVPHMPFVFHRDQNKPLLAIYDRSLDNYLDNLRYADRLVGELVETLKFAGKFDNAVLVLTSNHDWLGDVGLHDTTESGLLQWQHIPLLVKLPQQSERADIDTYFPVTRVQWIINYGLGGGRDGEELAGEVKGLGALPRHYPERPPTP